MLSPIDRRAPMLRTRVRGLLLVLLLGAAPLPAAAQEPGGWLDSFNQAMFAFNRGLADGADALLGLLPDAGAAQSGAVVAAENFLAHWINEPLTVVSHAIAGDMDAAGRSVRRFGINLVAGFGGFVDRATDWGVTVPRLDIGLALCRRGVGGGPYIVVPVVGPRTTRDAIADLVISNLIIYAMLIPVIGTNPSLTTFLVVEILDEFANLAIARQIDGPPPDWSKLDFDEVRSLYLAEREERCGRAE
jgi:phospholipid-binding lipoprotein MlaA